MLSIDVGLADKSPGRDNWYSDVASEQVKNPFDRSAVSIHVYRSMAQPFADETDKALFCLLLRIPPDAIRITVRAIYDQFIDADYVL